MRFMTGPLLPFDNNWVLVNISKQDTVEEIEFLSVSPGHQTRLDSPLCQSQQSHYSANRPRAADNRPKWSSSPLTVLWSPSTWPGSVRSALMSRQRGFLDTTAQNFMHGQIELHNSA